jgi:NAD(P)-dependent dehydrogenase (short-subunit alcohol dehydrogenase family)
VCEYRAVVSDPGVTLVTGAAGGIGAEVVRLLGERGRQAVALEADPTDREAVRAEVERLASTECTIVALVTAAGLEEAVPFGDLDRARWQRMLDVQLGGTANACWAVLPWMLAAGSGTIVTVTSQIGLDGCPGRAHQAAAQGAVVGLTRSLGWELASRGIRVNGVAPAPEVAPADAAEAVLLLLEEGGYFAGQTLTPNLGATA